MKTLRKSDGSRPPINSGASHGHIPKDHRTDLNGHHPSCPGAEGLHTDRDGKAAPITIPEAQPKVLVVATTSLNRTDN
jgi:hypothetical protein